MANESGLSYEAIMDSLADGVYTVDLDWNITAFNRAAARITGVPAEQAIGRKCWEVLNSSLCNEACVLRSSFDLEQPVVGKSVTIRRPDGRTLTASISSAPLRNERGETVGGVETMRDLSDINLIRRRLSGAYVFDDIVGKSPALAKIFEILPPVAESDSTVLILGDSGTGKELFARAVHNHSRRKSGPFIAVNCGALPENLLESELFGYKAGAFTDAKRDKAGRFHLARGGTIFLDEIADMPLPLQVKLLRVLQEKRFEPLGDVAPVDADVRVIAATNADLEERVAAGTFRRDLFYRLNVVALKLPSLTERLEDLPLLCEHIIRRLNLEKGKQIEGLSEDAMGALLRHDFPGNVRELENILEYAFILCPDGFIQLEHLPEQLARQGDTARRGPLSMEEIKCRAVKDALERNEGRKMQTCRELGISKDTLRRMLARCGEDGPPSRT